MNKRNEDGYTTGYTWFGRFGKFANYVPGGPWFKMDDPEQRQNNKEWRISWIEGVEDYARNHNLIAPQYNKPL